MSTIIWHALRIRGTPGAVFTRLVPLLALLMPPALAQVSKPATAEQRVTDLQVGAWVSHPEFRLHDDRDLIVLLFSAKADRETARLVPKLNQIHGRREVVVIGITSDGHGAALRCLRQLRMEFAVGAESKLPETLKLERLPALVRIVRRGRAIGDFVAVQLRSADLETQLKRPDLSDTSAAARVTWQQGDFVAVMSAAETSDDVRRELLVEFWQRFGLADPQAFLAAAPAISAAARNPVVAAMVEDFAEHAQRSLAAAGSATADPHAEEVVDAPRRLRPEQIREFQESMRKSLVSDSDNFREQLARYYEEFGRHAPSDFVTTVDELHAQSSNLFLKGALEYYANAARGEIGPDMSPTSLGNATAAYTLDPNSKDWEALREWKRSRAEATPEQLADDHAHHLTDAPTDALIRAGVVERLFTMARGKPDDEQLSKRLRAVFLRMLPEEPDAVLRVRIAAALKQHCKPGDVEAAEALERAAATETYIMRTRPVLQGVAHYLRTGSESLEGQ